MTPPEKRICIYCPRGLHEECEDIPCCCSSKSKEELKLFDQPDSLNRARVVKHGTYYKADEDITDPHSTGRKRAVKMYPINPEAPCEWRLLKDCGGGKNPIVGCMFGKQTVVHHGPDKNTLKNVDGNVHRICPQCHNRWHYFNDSGEEYDPNIPHKPVEATVDEVIKFEVDWKSGVFKHLTSKRWKELNSREGHD